MKKHLLILVLLASFSLALAGSARAANYAFHLQKETVNVYWQSDGTATIAYAFVFANDAGASPIDFVDVGVPTSAYALSNVSADVNGHPIHDIQTSTYVKTGVALGLGSDAIAPGATGTVHALISNVGQVLYPDDQDPAAYASAVFSPTWFDPALVHGQTDLTVIFHLPPGVQPNEPRYHTAETPFPAQPDAALDDKGQVTYTWHTAAANGSTQYTLGASFPAKYVTASAIVGAPPAGTTATPALPYSFQVKIITGTVDVVEGSVVSVSYDLVIANDAGAPPLDILQMYLPNLYYATSSAKVDDQTVTVSSSPANAGNTVVSLGQSAIAPGATRRVTLNFYSKDLLIPDNQQPGELTLTFPMPRFKPQRAHGPTDLTASVTLWLKLTPADVRVPTASPPHPEQLLPEASSVYPTYGWSQAQGDATVDHILQLSVPVSAAATSKPAGDSTSSGSGGSGLGGLIEVVGVFAVIGSVVYSLFARSSPVSVNRMEYLPPTVTVEGNGIKRGLTAVEAAVLLERPMDTILTMILFAVLKKGAATVTSSDPLALEVSAALPDGLYDYERDFLSAFQGEKARREDNLKAVLVKLVRSVSEKMRGFSRGDTVKYYEDIVEKAWQEVQAADTPEVKGQKLDGLMDWALIDHYYQGRLMQTLGSGPVPLPGWWGRYSRLLPSPAPAGSLAAPIVPVGLIAPTGASAPSGTSAPSGASLPALPGADFAAAIASGAQNFSSQVVTDIQSFTGQITAQTNPAPVSSGYHGGGGHCACACACAGCACACAGGGR